MKKYVLPIAIFFLGLIIAQVYFGIDISGTLEGFGDILLFIFKGPEG